MKAKHVQKLERLYRSVSFDFGSSITDHFLSHSFKLGQGFAGVVDQVGNAIGASRFGSNEQTGLAVGLVEGFPLFRTASREIINDEDGNMILGHFSSKSPADKDAEVVDGLRVRHVGSGATVGADEGELAFTVADTSVSFNGGTAVDVSGMANNDLLRLVDDSGTVECYIERTTTALPVADSTVTFDITDNMGPMFFVRRPNDSDTVIEPLSTTEIQAVFSPSEIFIGMVPYIQNFGAATPQQQLESDIFHLGDLSPLQDAVFASGWKQVDTLTITVENTLPDLTKTPAASVNLFVNNERQFEGVDFTRAGKALTWVETAFNVSVGDEVIAEYFTNE